MRIDILSLFPAMFDGPFGDSIIRRAVENGILDINITNPRDFADKRQVFFLSCSGVHNADN